jgi:hypothetical protein
MSDLPVRDDIDDDDDRYEDYKLDLMMGRINPDGSVRDPEHPEPPDPEECDGQESEAGGFGWAAVPTTSEEPPF